MVFHKHCFLRIKDICNQLSNTLAPQNSFCPLTVSHASTHFFFLALLSLHIWGEEEVNLLCQWTKKKSFKMTANFEWPSQQTRGPAQTVYSTDTRRPWTASSLVQTKRKWGTEIFYELHIAQSQSLGLQSSPATSAPALFPLVETGIVTLTIKCLLNMV